MAKKKKNSVGFDVRTIAYAVGNRIEGNPIIHTTSAQSPSIEVNISLRPFPSVLCFGVAQIKDDSICVCVCVYKNFLI